MEIIDRFILKAHLNSMNVFDASGNGVHVETQEHVMTADNKNNVTPFLPGMAHSQFMRFMVPSGFFVGTATNP